MNALAAAWRQQPGGIKLLVIALAVIALLNVAAALIGGDGEERRSGPPLVASDSDGFGGYASLLQSYDFPVSDSIEAGDTSLEEGRGTLVLLGPSETASLDGARIRSFVEAGGTAIVGSADRDLIGDLIADPPVADEPGPLLALPAGGQATGVTVVQTAGEASWRALGQTSPYLAGNEGPVVVEAQLGEGTVYLFADSSPLQNRLLAEADNALLGVELAGVERDPVSFALSDPEVAAGGSPGPDQGLSALPDEWIAVLLGLVAAALIAIAARARRIGPPEDPDRELMPARGAYVGAVGSTLARVGDREAAAAKMREIAVSRLSRTTKVDSGTDPERLHSWLRARGLEQSEAEALARGQANTKEAMMLAATGLAKLTESDRGW